MKILWRKDKLPIPVFWASLVAQIVKNLLTMWETWVQSLEWEDPGGGHGNPLQYSFLENTHRQRSLVGYSPWGRKESDTIDQLSTEQHRIYTLVYLFMSMDFPVSSVIKNQPASTGDEDSIPGQGDPLEEEMAVHSSILAWRIPWTEEPGWPQSMGSQRFGYDWAHTYTIYEPVGVCVCVCVCIYISVYCCF